MNRIDSLFSRPGGNVLSVYLTAGYPGLEDTPRLIRILQECGVDMVEVGIPFSDPLADGKVIQHSSQVALQNGMTLEVLFRQLGEVRDSVRMPLVLMGYLNPVLRMGMEPFLERCTQCGIDGVIIPDLPPEEYETRYRDLFQKAGLHHPLLVTPHTGEQRLRQIASLSGGFLYMVSDASTTGAREAIGDHQIAYFERVRGMELDIPALIGFGISNHDTFRTACSYASGAIIGSAFIRMLGDEGNTGLEERIGRFVESVRKG